MRALQLLFYFLFLIPINSLLAQKVVRPFQTHNQSPVVHFFGLPTNPGGIVLEKGEFYIGNYFNIANNATSAKKKGEAIYLDGEMYRNELQFSYGFLSKLELGISIPMVRHSAGVMDSFISDWHETFNLPEKSRKVMPTYNLNYFFLENESFVFNMNESKLRVGDISVSLSTPIFSGKSHKLALRSFLKLATGKKETLVGSGTNDFGVQLTGTIKPIIERGQFAWFYSLGYLRVGTGAVLDYKISRNVSFGSIGFSHNLNNKWFLKSQFDFHTSFYKDSETKQLGYASGQLVLGLDYLLTEKLVLTGAFIEDIIVNTAPDFTLQFGVSYHFK
ncbi:MAG: DUF3187 family protein [Labilibaculum sp.]|nr:DUF3187 family protein [Labilibaculum sp.]MBI9056654.1 DUF3187 family protein [Labilibaculum sp.]